MVLDIFWTAEDEGSNLYVERCSATLDRYIKKHIIGELVNPTSTF